MIDLTGVEHHPALEAMVDVLCNKTQNTDRGFFRVEGAYFLSKMASTQRATVVTKDRGDIPVNCFALALATSGYGKGHSIYTVEQEFLKGFKRQFMTATMPIIVEDHLWRLANDRAAMKGSEPQEEFNSLEREYRAAGAFPFTFDSGTAPAVKQLRQKLQLASCGSINLQIDEIGLNLIKETEVLTLFLEPYDQGLVKQKLVKETKDNQRSEEMDGKTPTNMMLFGTPVRLLDGGQTEDMFYAMLETGYARRCLFANGQHHAKAHETQTPTEIFHNLIQPSNQATIKQAAAHFTQLADPSMFNWKMTVEDDVAIKLIEYRVACERAAAQMKEHQEIQKAELNHRYFKALKLAGAYAFVDASSEVEMDHLMSAILLVEDSGKAFQQILNREKPYVKLARYIADIGTEVTHADLLEALPFYKPGIAARQEMMTLATAWGYKQHIIIKKAFIDGIEFFSGEKLQETDLNDMILSYSDHWAFNYDKDDKVPFDQLHLLTQARGMHWANHQFKNHHRSEENVLTGFNMVVIDVDKGTPLETAHELLKDYRFLTYTTKRHQVGEHGDRYRIILPINYKLELDAADYKAFMDGVVDWLPFGNTDESANQRSRKWESFDGGEFHYNDGMLLDALPFIPKTSRNEQHLQQMKAVQSLDNLERWFAERIASGNRNNQMIKYALALVDGGMTLPEVNTQVHSFNKKLNTPLTEEEIDTTIMVTVAKRYQRAA